MHTVYIHIDERLDAQQLREIGNRLSHLPHVTDVEFTPREPHDLLVEYEPHEMAGNARPTMLGVSWRPLSFLK